MAPSDYASAGSGKLKLKGVKDSKVDKKKKKKSSSKPKDETGAGDGNDSFQDRSVMLKNLEDEDAQLANEENSKRSVDDRKAVEPATGLADEDERDVVKTEAERKYEEQRRKRLEERLKREGVKTHKERVEELNRYLSGLSEHHDMPRIGPG
ncbi:hypothetical protein LTR10_013479 [Elasticomyces elasticus]|uniref:DUF1754-domain-containing protein n=1 Tax=Exophiala sideris TaxID=1016849 RepID=A0ABR0JQ02_9EURO|nr:hypothetical protein LTR10_013479 [Elasticomyces elasticus]KAK5039615.1 hypothetical protein LTS07_000109 [Exophiala sideris]KAK5041167.1 hypothetical protein LTR13_002641 [Exophiala sideris]KAK5067992.1 hypothetical protein LTR69_000109 [Exophiala sideris]KAK5187294.1 hypothetical protein LTR44_000109 [Eurotiomycetes sp. CCFEE 6388]